MKQKCHIVEDLLPLYLENMVSSESAEMIETHLRDCDDCRREYEMMKQSVGAAPKQEKEDIRPFRRLMGKINRQTAMLSYGIIILFIFFGFSLTDGADMMYNSLIMPLVGVFGYIVFRKSAIWKMPILLLVIDLAAWVLGMEAFAFAEVLMWSLLYYGFVLAGILVAWMCHFAFEKRGEQKKREKLLRGGAFLLAVAVILGLGSFVNALIGNPISVILVRNTAEKYIEENYAGLGYEIETVSYSFKDGNYYVHLHRADSMDGDFSLRIGMTGRLNNDSYASRVEGKSNVSSRLYMQYRSRIDEVLESEVFPYRAEIAFGELEFDRELGKEPIPGALTRADLENDRFYDMSELGKTNGTLVLYIDSETVDERTAAEILLTVKKLFDDAGVSFYSVELVLRYPPYDEESYARPDGEIRIDRFLSEDIYEDGMAERVHAAVEETRASYDGENEK